MRWYICIQSAPKVNHKTVWDVVARAFTYELAKEIAFQVLDYIGDGEAVEIRNDGLTKWGPYIKGGKFKP